ncbi:leupaxin isoform X3 [Bradysia coprophila]|uniref:leupaxin isoform X3 n=1 Tax=Bradysia coprophila TaxID=38358 RepID=UPI00187DB163|nr:leupaxin isoform X3 [Bradysia coprophila]
MSTNQIDEGNSYENVANEIQNYLDALLADLQNGVPGHQNNSIHNGTSSVPGYGSLRTKQQSPQSPSYQTQKVVTETRSSPVYNNGGPYHQGSLSRGNTPHNSLPRSSTPQQNPGNLSELDTLLQDLSSARYGSNLERNANGSVSPSPNVLSDSIKRPSVDSLLDELSNAHNSGPIYAVPNGAPSQSVKGPAGGKHVTITVRETKTERLTPVNTPSPQANVERQIVQTQQSGAPFASSATKELDDLMASLSDFKINSSSHQHQTVTEYAKPTKGISFSHSETTTTQTVQRDQLDSMLGNLQADMSRQGVTTSQKGCCNACDKPIVGQVITALGKTWHPEHFTCNHCNQELGTRNFFERDGHPYCEPDYHNLFSPRCAYCNGAILDKCVTALEKTWHTEHFFCAQCGQPFGEDGFHERDGKPYCRNDYFDMFAPKCNGCNRAIMENYISALNSQWHPDCFVCRDCRQPFQGGSFFDHEGLPYCETHYHAKRGSLCAGCSKPITGRCITAMFRKFHPEHFVCAFCLKALNKGTFKEQNDKPYCHGCFDKLFG